MAYYAAEGRISQSPIEGGVEITDQQYADALDAMLAGREITIDGGFAIRDKAPSPDHVWQDGEWVAPPAPPPPAPTAADVDAERDRRIANGFVFDGTAFQLDAKSQTRITAMGADARFAILAGAQEDDLRWADPDADFGWIATDNSVVPMDAQTMAAFADAAKLWVVRHTFAARTIKDMDPIPADYTSDSYWPTSD